MSDGADDSKPPAAKGRPTKDDPRSLNRIELDAPPGHYSHFEPENYAGIPKQPPVVTHANTVKKFAPKRLTHRLKYIIQLAAMGCSREEIAERSGYSPTRLSTVFNSPIVSNEVERTRLFIFERDAERALKTMVPKALSAIDGVLSVETTNFKEMVSKSDVAFSLLERTHGKAKQSIEMGGNLLADLLNMMDARDARASAAILEAERAEKSRGEISDADFEEAPETAAAGAALQVDPRSTPSDPLDSYLDHNFPEKGLK